MGDIGILTKVEDLTGVGSDEPVRQLQVIVNGPLDPRTCELLRGFGQDFGPTLGSRILIIDEGHNWKLGRVLHDGTDAEAADGEYILYSTDPAGLIRVAKIKMGSDSSVEISACPMGVEYGTIKISGLTGQISLNDNLTVDV